MKLLVATPEFAPLASTGGLGYAVAGLSRALTARGHEVTVALPRYASIDVPLSPAHGRWWTTEAEGVPVMLFDDGEAFGRPKLYGPSPGIAYDDNWRRFGRFSLAVAALAGDYDLVHLNDGHVGAVALLTTTPTVLTLHNAAYSVLGPLAEVIELLGVDPGLGEPGAPLEWFGKANYLKAGIVSATQVTTVSPTHAKELADDATSFGLGGIVRALRRPIVGILNGISSSRWDPATDTTLPQTYSAEDLGGRRASRAALLAWTGLADGVIFGNVGRMSPQKGLHLLGPELDALVSEGVRLVLMGCGEIDAMVNDWAARYPRAVVHLDFDPTCSRLVFAGSDAYLMPSAFEPSGLGQLYAMRYGAPPVARLTGGLADCVIDIDEDLARGNGLAFRSFGSATVAKTMRRAMRYREGFPDLWAGMQRRGMSTDWSWDARAHEYEALFAEIIRG